MFESKAIVDRLRPKSLVEQSFDLGLPLFQLGYLLRRGPRRQRLQHDCSEHLELRQRVGAALQHSGLAQRTSILFRGVPADAQLPRCAPLRQSQSVQSHQLLQSMHVRPPRAHLSVQASFAQTFLGPCRPRPSLDPKPDPEWIRLADLTPSFVRFPPPQGGSAWPISGGSAWPIRTGSAWAIARGSHRPIRDNEAYRRQLGRLRAQRAEAAKNAEGANEELDDAWLITAQRTLELAKSAAELWVSRSGAEKRALLEMMVSNPTLSGRKLTFELKKPFTLLAEIRRNGVGRAP